MNTFYFIDVSFANLKNGSSQRGFIVFYYGSDKHAPIAWNSIKPNRVVKSTLSAEMLALEDALESSFMIRSLSCELLNKEIKHISNLLLHWQQSTYGNY